MNIHFVGVGKMGLPMAAHFLAAGHAVSVSDADPARLKIAAAQGLAVAVDSARAVADAEVIFSSLPNDEALRDVALQVIGAAKRGSTFVDTSTVSVQASSDVAGQCAAAGLHSSASVISPRLSPSNK
jgi:3-hydroxyisobutyrate dehydrogenase-like beta-hydroxyacid dehydrogenase